MMVETLFTNPFFVQTVLPFLLVFTLIFAILEKTEILGKEKRQIDAIVSLAIALIFVAFGSATEIVVRMIPVLGIALVVILVFLILFGSLFKQEGFEVHYGLKIGIGILIGLVVIVTTLVLTGGLNYISSFISSPGSGAFVLNGILVVVIIGAIAAVVWGGKGSDNVGGKANK